MLTDSADETTELPEAGTITRTRILTVGRRLFAQQGYGGTSMATIAKALKNSAPALYWHFESKEALLFAIIEDGMEDILAFMDENGNEPRLRLRDLITTYTEYQLERSEDVAAHSLLMRQAQDGHLLSDDRLVVIRAQQRRVYRMFADVIAKGPPENFTCPIPLSRCSR